jgi:hypothetical protein
MRLLYRLQGLGLQKPRALLSQSRVDPGQSADRELGLPS